MNMPALWFLLSVAFATGAPAAASTKRFDFDAATPDQPPAGFSLALTGAGAPGRWLVQQASDAPSGRLVLAQTDAYPTSNRFPLCIAEDVAARDVRLSVRFKPVSGRADQAAGLVWRYRDRQNYYVARANALDGNVVAYADSVALFDDLSIEVPDSPSGSASVTGLNTARIEELTGAKGAFDQKEAVFKVSVPRSDLAVTTAGVKMTPPLGLTSWAAFMKAGRQTMVMGDTVMLEDQVSPVMSVALDNGLEVTALHNHFFWDSPKVMFMHVGGMGDEEKLAAAVGKVFAKIRETGGGRGEVPKAAIDPAQTSLNAARIEQVLGIKGQLSAGVYKLTVGRTVSMHGHRAANAMGVNTWAAFAGSDQEAVVDGDFAVLEGELQDVLKALRAGGIHVVAIHQHMTHEEPRMIFLHYWGIGPTDTLARTLRAALDKTSAER